MLLFTSIDRRHFYIRSNLALAKYPLLQNQSVEFPQIFKICYLFNYIITGCVYHGHYHHKLCARFKAATEIQLRSKAFLQK